MIARVLSLLALFTAVVSQNTVKDCSSGTSVFKFTSGSILPDPVIPGQNSSLTINAEIPDGTIVTDGSATYGITLNGIPFPGETDSLCSQVTCPLLPGPYTNTTTSTFPSGISGKIVTTIKWYDTNNNLLLCTAITTRV
jgi:hypothetical protein